METKTIIYLVAAALVLRVVIRTIIRFLREGSDISNGNESVDSLDTNDQAKSDVSSQKDKLDSKAKDSEEE